LRFRRLPRDSHRVHRVLAFGTLVGFLLSTLGALGQEPAPPAPPPVPSATPPPAEPSAPPAAPAPSDTAEPPAAPPVSAVSAGTPTTSGTSPPAPKPVDHGPEPKRETKASDPWQDAHALGAEGSIYASGRLGPSSIEPADEERFGVGFDLSAWFTLSTEYVLGFGLTHADLGNVSAGSGGVDEIEVDYGVTAAYLGARAFPVRRESWEIFVGLRVGLAWQDLDARGVRTLEPNVSPPASFTCSGVSGPDLALGAGIGGALRLGRQAWLTGHLDANGYKLTSDVIENCTVGIGSVTNVTLGAGLLYAFDLGSEAKLDARAAPRAQTW